MSPAVINPVSKQARCYAAEAKASPTEVSSILEQRIRGVQEEVGLAETGRVLSVGYAETLGRTKCRWIINERFVKVTVSLESTE